MSTVSGPGLSSCLRTAGTNAETDIESGRATVYDSSSVVTTAVAGVCSSPRAETILSGKLLQSMKMLKQFKHGNSVAHLVPALDVSMLLSELGPISIDDDLGARDKRRRGANFPCKEPTILRMGLFLDGLSLDMMMMIVKEDLTVGTPYTIQTGTQQG